MDELNRANTEVLNTLYEIIYGKVGIETLASVQEYLKNKEV